MASRLIVLIFVAPYRSKAMLSSRCIYAPDAGSSPRKPGSLPMNRFRVCRFATHCRFRLKPTLSAHRRSLCLGSPSLAARSPGWQIVWGRYIRTQKESRRTIKTQHIHMTIKPCDRAGIVDGTEKHRSVNTFFTRNQLLPEGGGLSERTKATNSGFLRKPANSLSRKAPLMG